MRRFSLILFAVTSFTMLGQPADVQAQQPAKTGGFKFTAPSFASGAERQGQSNLWVFEVNYKSMRMVEVPITDKKTGVKKKELIYYLVYKLINRTIEKNVPDPDKTPVNQFDTSPVPETFVPEIILASNDNGDRRSHRDSIIPEAEKFIEAREGRSLLNTVEIVRKVPQAFAKDDKNAKALYGVAIFRGVNPDTDYFTLYFSGFSNGYKLVNGPLTYDAMKAMVDVGELKVGDQVWDGDLKKDWIGVVEFGDLFNPRGEPPADPEAQFFVTTTTDRADESTQVWRKTLVQRYWRPGDRFDQNEREIRTKDSNFWLYAPDDVEPAKSALLEKAVTLKPTKQ